MKKEKFKTMLEKLQEIFREITGATDIELTEKTRIKKVANVSSLTMVQLICSIEDEFDIEIPNSQIKKFKTVKDLLVFIEKETE